MCCVLSAQGVTQTDPGSYPVKPGEAILMGEAILVAAGERHVARNTGTAPLVLLRVSDAGEDGWDRGGGGPQHPSRCMSVDVVCGAFDGRENVEQVQVPPGRSVAPRHLNPGLCRVECGRPAAIGTSGGSRAPMTWPPFRATITAQV